MRGSGTFSVCSRVIALCVMAVAVSAAGISCSMNDDQGNGEATARPSPTATAEMAATATSGETMVMEVVVGPKLEDCVGSHPMRCMVVDGSLFYSEIEGFDYEEGYEYRLRIEEYDPWGGEEPPQDASAYNYRLIELLSKTEAGGGMVTEVVVGPKLEDCVGSHPMRCMVVDGSLFYSEIEGFDYEEGYEYRLRIEEYDPWGGEEPPQDASAYNYRLIELLSKTEAGGGS